MISEVFRWLKQSILFVYEAILGFLTGFKKGLLGFVYYFAKTLTFVALLGVLFSFVPLLHDNINKPAIEKGRETVVKVAEAVPELVGVVREEGLVGLKKSYLTLGKDKAAVYSNKFNQFLLWLGIKIGKLIKRFTGFVVGKVFEKVIGYVLGALLVVVILRLLFGWVFWKTRNRFFNVITATWEWIGWATMGKKRNMTFYNAFSGKNDIGRKYLVDTRSLPTPTKVSWWKKIFGGGST